jgi:hypothetical protein
LRAVWHTSIVAVAILWVTGALAGCGADEACEAAIDAGPYGMRCEAPSDCPTPFSCVRFAGSAASTCQLDCETGGDCGRAPLPDRPCLFECNRFELEDDPAGGSYCVACPPFDAGVCP